MIPLIAKMMSKAVILAALVAMAQAKDGTSPPPPARAFPHP